MKTIDKINWVCAAAMVSLTIFVTGKVDGTTFIWLGLFVSSTYGCPLYLHSWDRRLMYELSLLRRYTHGR